MAMTVAELQVKVGADVREAESGLASLGSKIGSVGGAIGTAFGAAAIGGIAALGAGLAASVSAAANFEQAMSGIKAVSGATAPEMQQLSALALQLGADTSFSATEAAAGIGELVKAGVSIGDVLGGGAAAALNLAAGGELSVAESAEIASNAMNVFGLKGADVGRVADVIAGAAIASSIDVRNFGLSLAASGSVAATVGIGFEDLGTAIAVMGQAGIKGSDAGTSLKTMLLNLTPSTKQQMEAAQQLGIVTADGANKFFDASGKAKSMSEIAGVLQDATKGLTEQQKLQALQTLFGTDAIRAASIMAKAGAEGFDTMAASIGKVSAADVAKTRLDNLKGSLEQLKGSLETAGIQLGTMLLPGLKGMVDGLTEWVNKGIEVIQRLPAAWDDIKTAFAGGATTGGLSALLASLGLSDTAVANVEALTKRIGDAWRTMQQAFAGDWSPSAQIDPFVNSVGIAATKVREFKDTVVDAVAKAQAMGAWDNVKTGFTNLAEAAKIANDRILDITASMQAGRDPAEKVASAADVIAAALKGAALGWQYATLQLKGFTDSVGTSINVVVNYTTGLMKLGDAWNRLQKGDIPGAISSLDQAKDAFGRGTQALEDFRQRGLERASEAGQTFADLMGIRMTATASAVQTNMDAANKAVAEGSSGMQRFMEENGAGMVTAAETAGQGVAGATETGMTNAVSAVQTQGPNAVSAAEQMGTGMTTAIENAGPPMTAAADAAATGVVSSVEAQQGAAGAAATAMGDGMTSGIASAQGPMAAAAEQGATGAVSAVQAQQGAASAAGQGVGDSIGAGLQSGILAWAGRIASAAADLVRRAIGAAREEADSNSPSKKMQRFADDLMSPVEQRVARSSLSATMRSTIGEALPQPRSSAGILPPAPAMAGRGGGAGGTQTIRLDVAVGGRVAEEIVVEGYELAVRRGRLKSGL